MRLRNNNITTDVGEVDKIGQIPFKKIEKRQHYWVISLLLNIFAKEIA